MTLIAKEAVDLAEAIVFDKPGEISKPAELENARQYEACIPFDVERVEIDIPEEQLQIVVQPHRREDSNGRASAPADAATEPALLPNLACLAVKDVAANEFLVRAACAFSECARCARGLEPLQRPWVPFLAN